MDSTRNADDIRRLDLLRMLDLLSPDPEPAFDRLSRIAASVTGSEIAMITFIAGDRQFIRSRVGIPASEASAWEGLCICTPDGAELVEICDATRDERFVGKEFARAIRSYVGMPVLFDGLAVGTVCVLDSRPRRLSDDQRAILGDLAGMVESLLQSRHKQLLLHQERQRAVELAAALGESERLARESAERDRLLWQTSTDVVLTMGEDSLIRFCNPAILPLLGYRPEDVLGRPLAMLQPERLRAAHRHGLERYVESGKRKLDWRAVEVVALHRDGREIPVEVAFSDMQIGGRRIFGAFLRDVSQRVQQQQALQRSEECYRRIVQTAEEGIWMIDAASVTTFVNPKMASMLGYTVQEMLGRPMYDFMDEHARATARENVRRREQGISEQHDFRLARKDGGDLWTAMSTSAAFDDAGHYAGALAMVTDITERRRAEEALRESEERFRSLTVLSSDWYWEHDKEFRLTKVAGGRAYDNSVGLRRVIGQRPWEAASEGMDPADWDRHRRQLEAHEPFRDFEITHRGADGDLYTVSVSGEPVFDADGRFTGYRGVGRDITEQRRGQTLRLDLEAQLRESQKMEAIGVLAGGIAHDFNNVLAGILGNVALASQDLPPEHPAAASLEQIRKASLRGRGLVQQILAFARRQPREVASCELRPLVEDCIGLLRSTLPAGVTLEVSLCDEPLFVMADATQVEQVLMNLCTNAWHSLGGKPGRIAVALAGADLDADAARQLGAGLTPGAYARLSVVDDGRGMDAETRARIFEPFFTTKPVGEGTGLGLAVAHGIIAAHGGVIRVQTTQGQGSTLPAALRRRDPHRPAGAAGGRPPRPRRKGALHRRRRRDGGDGGAPAAAPGLRRHLPAGSGPRGRGGTRRAAGVRRRRHRSQHARTVRVGRRARIAADPRRPAGDHQLRQPARPVAERGPPGRRPRAGAQAIHAGGARRGHPLGAGRRPAARARALADVGDLAFAAEVSGGQRRLGVEAAAPPRPRYPVARRTPGASPCSTKQGAPP